MSSASASATTTTTTTTTTSLPLSLPTTTIIITTLLLLVWQSAGRRTRQAQPAAAAELPDKEHFRQQHQQLNLHPSAAGRRCLNTPLCQTLRRHEVETRPVTNKHKGDFLIDNHDDDKPVGEWISVPSPNFIAMATRVRPTTFCMVSWNRPSPKTPC